MPDPAHGIELCEEAARLSEALLYCGDEQTTRAAGVLGPCRRIDEAALEPRHRWQTRGMGVARGYVATGFVNRNRQWETWRSASPCDQHVDSPVVPAIEATVFGGSSAAECGRSAGAENARPFLLPQRQRPIVRDDNGRTHQLPPSPRDLVGHIGGGHSGDCELVEPRHGVLTSEGKTDRAGKGEAGHVVSLTTHMTTRTRVSAPVQKGRAATMPVDGGTCQVANPNGPRWGRLTA
jgi:hypothetical protein